MCMLKVDVDCVHLSAVNVGANVELKTPGKGGVWQTGRVFAKHLDGTCDVVRTPTPRPNFPRGLSHFDAGAAWPDCG